MKGIIGRKLGMTQVFSETGEVVPVTVLEAGPCYVTQIKSEERDGYGAIQLGFEETKPKRLTRAQRGHLKNLPPLRYLREVRTSDWQAYELGQKIEADIFEVGEKVDVTGMSKGRGFAGGMKRYGFGGGRATHGQSDRARAPGSIGAGTTPGRVIKGLRMAGHMGNERVTVQNLEVVMVDAERNLLAVRGSVPGAKNSLVLIREAIKG
ncbi:MAG: 50S ribosomal protein L3 [Anaerolineae bacterium]